MDATRFHVMNESTERRANYGTISVPPGSEDENLLHIMLLQSAKDSMATPSTEHKKEIDREVSETKCAVIWRALSRYMVAIALRRLYTLH